MAKDLFLGIDVGSSGTRGVLVDGTGRRLADERLPHGITVNDIALEPRAVKETMTMTLLDPYLLEALTERCSERPVAVFDGVVRFDVREGEELERWYLTMKKGMVTVARTGAEPDCVVSGDRATFEAILSGRANAMAALLRGALAVQGKVVLLTVLQRLFPGSPGAEGLPAAGYAERQS